MHVIRHPNVCSTAFATVTFPIPSSSLLNEMGCRPAVSVLGNRFHFSPLWSRAWGWYRQVTASQNLHGACRKGSYGEGQLAWTLQTHIQFFSISYAGLRSRSIVAVFTCVVLPLAMSVYVCFASLMKNRPIMSAWTLTSISPVSTTFKMCTNDCTAYERNTKCESIQVSLQHGTGKHVLDCHRFLWHVFCRQRHSWQKKIQGVQSGI